MSKSENTRVVINGPTTTLASGGTSALVTSEVDTLGFDRARVVVYVGTVAASGGITTIQAKHSDTSGSGYTNLDAVTDPFGEDDDNQYHETVINLEGLGRYLDVDVTTSNSGNTPTTCVVVLERGTESPVEYSDLKARVYRN